MYRVIRQEYNLDDLDHSFENVIQKGFHPSEYTDGIGCFDESPIIINRWFQKHNESTDSWEDWNSPE